MISVKRFWVMTTMALAMLTLLLAWGISYLYLEKYTQVIADRLQLLSELRKGAVEQHFSTAEAELSFWSLNPDILSAQAKLNQLWEATPDKALAMTKLRQFYVDDNPFSAGEYRNLDDAGDGSDYSRVHRATHPMSKLFVTVRGYYDVFLIGIDGDIFYSVEKESDYATNLLRGEWRETGLADVFRRAVDQREQGHVAISDMASYGPSDGAPAIFMARALSDSNGDLLGVIAFQLPTAEIMAIMNYTSGMGETGETYLVGQDNLMRSDSRFTQETAVMRQSVISATVVAALKGKKGVDFVADYRGVEVLSAYTNLRVGETRWAVMAEIDRAEIVLGAAGDRPNLSGILLFFYGLSMWSVWYWRGGQRSGDGSEYASLDLDLDSSDFGDISP